MIDHIIEQTRSKSIFFKSKDKPKSTNLVSKEIIGD